MQSLAREGNGGEGGEEGEKGGEEEREAGGGRGGGGGGGEEEVEREWRGAGRALLEMHPTAAVCGKPRDVTYPVIGEVEGFDRSESIGRHSTIHK